MSSRRYRGERIVVWPSYIDSNTTRGGGRRIPRDRAVPRPRVEEIVKAAEHLGLEPVVEDKAYPKDWMRERKRVVVLRRWGRVETLKRIATEIRRLRSTR